MNRRSIVLMTAALLAPLVIWYATQNAGVPSVAFDRAAAIGDSVKKVQVYGYVDQATSIEPDGSALTFYMNDRDGNRSKVFYDGTNVVPVAILRDAASEGLQVSVAGHSCGDRFHAKNLYIDP